MALSLSVISLGCSKDQPSTDEQDTGIVGTDTGETGPQYEEGCILVDGAGGYKWLEDAMTVAGEGSTITLCEGELNLSIEIQGSLSLIGPGADLLTWTADVNKPAISVAGGANVTLSGFTVSSTRNGIEVNNSTDVTISGVTFVEVLGTGVRSIDSTNTTVDDCDFIQPPYEDGPGPDTGSPVDTGSPADTGDTEDSGVSSFRDTGEPASEEDVIPYTPNPIGYGGVEVSGGDATVSNSTFIQMVGFAIHGINGGTITAANNDVFLTWFSEPDADGNVSDGFGLWVQDGSTLNTSANLLDNNFVGIFADEGDINLVGDSIYNGAYGIFAVNGAFNIDGVRVENPMTLGMRLVSSTDEIILTNSTIWGDPEIVSSGESMDGLSTGVLIAGANADVSDTTIYGWNYMGLQVIPYDNEISAKLDNVLIENTATMGLYCGQGDFDLTDVSVKDFRTPYDPYSEDGGSISSGFATSFWYSDVSWNGGGVSDSEFIGSLAAFSTLSLDGVTVEGNAEHGIWIYDSTAAISGSTFSRSSASGGIVSSSGDITLTGSTFTNNLEQAYSEYDTGTVVYGYLYHYQSQDIVSYSGSRLDINNNVFEDGSESIRIVGGTNTNIESNSWSNYNRNVLYAYATDDTVNFSGNSGTDIGAYWVYCQSSDIEVTDDTLNGMPGYNYKTTYFQDGVETGDYEATWYNDAIYSSSCNMFLQNVDISNTEDHIGYFYDSSVEIYDSSFSASSNNGSSEYGTIEARWSAAAPSFIASGLNISNVLRGHGVHLDNNGGQVGTVVLTDISVDNVAQSGLSLAGLGESSVDISDITSTNNGYAGFEAANVTASLTALSATGNSVGMVCDESTSFDPCETISLEGNATEHLGCAAACDVLEPAPPTDTGDTGDTGETGQ